MTKILLLEDNSMDADLVRMELKNSLPHAELIVVNRLAEARKLMLNKPVFNIALFDLKLPDGNGMELLSELREQHCDTPIIILTGEGSEEIAITALKAGANDYIPKKPGFQKLVPGQIEFTLKHALANQKHLSVLYVEHHKSDIDLTRHHFKRVASYIHLTTVSTGTDGLKLLPESNESVCEFDVLLLDYRLPGLNALEIAKIIRHERKLSIAIVIVTGQGDEKIAVEALKIGVDDYVVKHDNYLLRMPSVITSAYRRRELERQKQALKQSETKFRLLADYAADWEYWINPEGEYVYISPACEKTSGYPPEAFKKNKNLLIEIVHPDFREIIKEHYTQKVKILHKPIEFLIVTADGKEKWISHFCRPVYDENNNYLGKRGVNRDITEQMQAQISLKQSEKRSKSIIEQATDALFIIDFNGNIVEANNKACENLGFTREEFLSMSISDLDKSYSDIDFRETTIHQLQKGENVTIESYQIRKNGTSFPAETSLGIIELKNEKVILGFVRDISERKRAELVQEVILNISNASDIAANLEETMQIIQQELGRLMNTKNFFVAFYNRETDQLSLPYYKDEKYQIGEFPAGKTLTRMVIKKGQSLLINEDKIIKLQKEGRINRVGYSSKIWLGVPLKIKGKIIGAFVIQSYSNAEAYTEKDKEILEIISKQISISVERKSAEEKLLAALESAKESDRMKTVFLANMSHELRTPLNSVIGFSDIISEDWPIEEIVRFNKIINGSGKHLLNIVEDLFDVTLIETGETKIINEDFELISVIDSVRNMVEDEQKRLNKQDISINFEIPDESKNLIVHSDASKLRQILLNLLKNSLKFTHEGHIRYGYKIDLTKENPAILFYVEDTGIGVPKEKQKYIFDVFRQVEESNTRTYGGTGLGLTISKNLTELLGGQIWLESEVEKGTTFYFTLPYDININRKVKNKKIDKTKVESKLASSNKKILIVEDDESNYNFLEVVLENSGLEIIWAKNGKEAIEFCTTNTDINLVLMDINLPDMSGYEVTKKIKGICNNLTIIATTAYALAGDREKSIKAGCDNYIAKPIKPAELLKLLNNYLI